MQIIINQNLSSLQVDVLQVAVVEIQVTAVSFLVSELHQICGKHTLLSHALKARTVC